VGRFLAADDLKEMPASRDAADLHGLAALRAAAFGAVVAADVEAAKRRQLRAFPKLERPARPAAAGIIVGFMVTARSHGRRLGGLPKPLAAMGAPLFGQLDRQEA